MEPAESTIINFFYHLDSSSWWWTSCIPNPNFDRVSKGQWRQFSLWADRYDEGRAGFEEAVEQFKSVISDIHKHILVIEYDPSMCDLFRLMLNRAGLWLRTASDGNQGLDILKREEFGLLIHDITMLDMNGFEFIVQIRADARWDTLPIVVTSARADAFAISKALEIGADAYVTRPFSPTVLREQVQRLLIEGRKKPDLAAADP